MRFLFSVLLFFTSCTFESYNPYRHKSFYAKSNLDVEVNCQGSQHDILILYTDVKQVKNALESAVKLRKEYGTNENYTVLRFNDRESVFLSNITPYQLINNCTFTEKLNSYLNKKTSSQNERN